MKCPLIVRFTVPVAALVAIAAAACGGDGSNTAEPDLFIPFERDFQGFRKWRSFSLSAQPGLGMAHLAGPRTDYINRIPPKGSATFPIGTIVVKELEIGDLPQRQLFAMVKRGGGFNQTGARDWEWFELQNRSDGSVGIVWHGKGPPDGETYGGDPANGCNECHAMAAKNDYVRSMPLDLTRF